MPQTEAKEKPAVLNRATLVPIGLAVSMLLPLAAGAVWLNAEFTLVKYRLKEIENKLELATDDRWKRGDMAAWGELLQARNKDLDVPKIPTVWEVMKK